MNTRADPVPDPATGRLASASDLLRNVSATFGYTPNSNWNSAVNTSSAATQRLQTVRTPDGLGRLATISSTVPGQSAPVESHTYHYNAKGLRQEVNVAGGEKWVYGYNARNEVTSGVRRLDSGADVPGTSFGYNFDAIGNRTSTTVNGRTASYTQNGQSLNQYGAREVPGFIDVSGTATASALVQVNGVTATRQGSRYWVAAPVDDPATPTVESNAAAPVWATIAVKAYLASGGGAQDTRQILPQPNAPQHRFVPKTPEVFKYDEDGNLEEDGRWKYTWDGENRLIQMDTLTAAISAGVPRKQLKFAYDALGRRVQKEVWDPNTSGTLVLSRRERFIYQTGGWNLLARVNGLGGNALQQSYLWGMDLSGSLSGAGGVGGLLSLYDQASVQSYLPSYDGNGNVMALTAASNGTDAARYSYGPFGEAVLATGLMAEDNPFRFSTKFQDRETGLLYYGYRYYQPQTGRWINRDPLQERGGTNLYAFVRNVPLSRIDALGLLSTNKFQSWYFNKGGAEYDIVAEGELDELKKLLEWEIKAIIGKAYAAAEAEAVKYCAEGSGEIIPYSNRGNAHKADLTTKLFYIGDTTIFWGVEGALDIDCCAKTWELTSALIFQLKDKGRDPLDIFDIIPGEIEIGDPFAITALWADLFRAKGRF